jgi:hypothetical protein
MPDFFFEIGAVFIINEPIENHIQNENRHQLPLLP